MHQNTHKNNPPKHAYTPKIQKYYVFIFSLSRLFRLEEKLRKSWNSQYFDENINLCLLIRVQPMPSVCFTTKNWSQNYQFLHFFSARAPKLNDFEANVDIHLISFSSYFTKNIFCSGSAPSKIACQEINFH